MRKNCLEFPVEIVEDVFAEENAALAAVLKNVTGAESPRVVLAADQNLVRHVPGLGTKLGTWFKRHGVTLAGTPVILAGGERAKVDWVSNVRALQKAVLEARLEANEILLAIGGGSVLDVCGYVAAQTRGGVGLVRIPSTPSAMVDGAFAHTAAIDAAGVKDAFRLPSHPLAVVIDPTLADTVLDGVWSAGYISALRLALVQDGAFAKKLLASAGLVKARDAAFLRDIIGQSVALRQKKGGTDFALWAAQRLEAMSGYKLPYGYAVSLGIAIDMAYAVERGLVTARDWDRVWQALDDSGVRAMAMNSQPLVADTELFLAGLDAWRLAHGGNGAIVLPKGVGKSVEEIPDRGAMKRASEMIK